MKILLLLILSCSAKLNKEYKNLELKDMYKKKHIMLDKYLNYMEKRNKGCLEKYNIPWLNKLIASSDSSNEDIDYLKRLSIKDTIIPETEESTSEELIEPIFAAAILNKPNTLKKLLDDNAYFSSIDIEGNNPLHFAAYFNSKEVFNILNIKKDSDTNKDLAKEWLSKSNSSQLTPYHLAALKGNIDILKLFYSTKVKENKDILGNKALVLAASKGFKEALDLLDMEENKEAILYYSILSKDLEFFKSILGKIEIDLNFKSGKNQSNLLMLSAQVGAIDILKYLIEEKKLNFKNEDLRKRNSLFYAVKGNEKEILLYLLDLFKKDTNNSLEKKDLKRYRILNEIKRNTLLSYAMKKNNKEIIDIIAKECREEILAKSIKLYIKQGGNEETVLNLIANKEFKEANLNKILFPSIEKEFNSVIRKIVNKKNVDTAYKNVTPLCYSIIKDNPEAVSLFRNLEADVNKKFVLGDEEYSSGDLIVKRNDISDDILDISQKSLSKFLSFYTYKSDNEKIDILKKYSCKGDNNSWLTLSASRFHKSILSIILNDLERIHKKSNEDIRKNIEEIINYKSAKGSALAILSSFNLNRGSLNNILDILDMLLLFNNSQENIAQSYKNLKDFIKSNKDKKKDLEDLKLKLDSILIDSEGNIGFMRAILENDLKKAILLTDTANLSIKNKEGKDSLILASDFTVYKEDRMKLISILLEKETNVKTIDNDNKTALFYLLASIKSFDLETKYKAIILKILNKFIEKGADINHKDDFENIVLTDYTVLIEALSDIESKQNIPNEVIRPDESAKNIKRFEDKFISYHNFNESSL